MSIGEELGQYILQTEFKKNLKFQWGRSLNAPSGYAGGLTYSYGKYGQPAEVNVWSARQ